MKDFSSQRKYLQEIGITSKSPKDLLLDPIRGRKGTFFEVFTHKKTLKRIGSRAYNQHRQILRAQKS